MISSEENRLLVREKKRFEVLETHSKGILPFVITGLVIGLVYLFVEQADWPNTVGYHFAIQSISIVINTLAAIALITYHFFKPSAVLLTVGMALIGSSILFGLHLSDHIQQSGSQFDVAFSDELPAAILISPLLISSLLLMVCIYEYYLSAPLKRLISQSQYLLPITSIVAIAVALSVQVYIQTYFPHGIPTKIIQAMSLVTLVFFFAAFAGFLLKSKPKLENFNFWVIFYIGCQLSIHFPLLQAENNLIPAEYSNAEIMRIVGSFTLISGLICNALSIIRQEVNQLRKLDRQNKATELLYSGTLIAINSDSLESAASQCLRKLCVFGNWDISHFCIFNEDDKLSHFWYPENTVKYAPFVKTTEELGIEFGIGLSGRIWEGKHHDFIKDISASSDFRRKISVKNVGLNSVLALPIVTDGKVRAILEFYREESTAYDTLFLSTAHSLCEQLANLYMRQKRTDDLIGHEILLRELFDSFPSGMATFDKEDRLTIFNQQFVDINDKFSELIVPGADYSDLLTASAYRNQVMAAAGQEQEWIEKRLELHRDGYTHLEREFSNGRHYRISEIPMPSSGTIGIWSDITEIKQNEKKLLDAMEMLKASLSGFPGAVCVFDPQLHLIATNQSFYSMLDISKTAIREGTTFDELLAYLRLNQNIYNEFIGELCRLRALIAKTKMPQTNSELLVVERAFTVHAAPMPGGGFAISLIDITKTKNYETSLRDARDSAENSAQSARQFAKSAKAANIAKSEFLATMSHEIRTPMNGILTTTDLLEETTLSDGQARYLKTIKGSAFALLRILNDILDLSKIEANQLSLESIPVNLWEFMDSIEELWAFQAASKELALVMKIDPNLPRYISVDPNRLQQILNNLIGNAVKFTSEGLITISITQTSLSSMSDEPDLLHFEIEDTGMGITEGNQAKLFRKFTQGDSTTTRKYGGTGLGLSICQQLAKLMGGSIGIKSEITKGATFWFDIELCRSTLEDLQIYDQKTNRNTNISEYEGPALNILVAEDHPVNQAVILEILKKWGHEVYIVANGEDAVSEVANGKYDLVLMDVQMPEMDGYTATREIRKFPGHISQIPIIAVTANAMIGDRQKCIDSGMNDFIAKPIERWELKSTLLNYGKSRDQQKPNMVIRSYMQDIPEAENSANATNITPPPITEIEEEEQKEVEILDLTSVNELEEMLGRDVIVGLFNKMKNQYEIQRISALQAIEDKDKETIGRESHMFKSTFAQFGLKAASELAFRVNTFCNCDEEDEAFRLMPELIEKCDLSLEKLEEWMNQTDNT